MALDIMSMMMSGMLPATEGSFGQTPTPDMGVMRAMQQMRPIRMMEMMNRQPAFGRGRGGGGGASEMGGMNEPDYSSASFDPEARAAADKALSPYGLHPLDPSQVQHNALLPNSGFFGNHPRLSGAMEGALFAAANTRPSNTPGEGISNAAQGLLAGTMQRRGMLNRQFETPFRQAGMMQQLQHSQMTDQLDEAQIQRYRAMANHYDDAPEPHPVPLSRDAAGFSTWNSKTGTWETKENPYYDPKTASPLHNSLQGQMVTGRFGEPPEPGGAKDNKKGSPTFGMDSSQQYWDKVNHWMQGNKVEVAGASAGAAQHGRNAADAKDDINKSDTYKNDRAEYQRQLGELNKTDFRKQVRNDVTSKKLANSKDGKFEFPTEKDIDAEIGARRDKLTSDFNSKYPPKNQPQGAPSGRRVIDLTK